MKLNERDIARFWAKVQIAGPDDCWEWQSKSRDSKGYGRFRLNRRLENAHRVAWEIANGPVPKGMNVCHKRDNPPCVNPAHLFLGTDAENVADKVAKGRQPEGEGHWNVSFSDEEIVEMRELLAGGVSTADAAKRFGTDDGYVSAVCIGKRRKGAGGPRTRRDAAKGEKNGRSRLTAEKVRQIKRRLGAGESERSLAQAFGMSRGAIRHIKNGRNWAGVE